MSGTVSFGGRRYTRLISGLGFDSWDFLGSGDSIKQRARKRSRARSTRLSRTQWSPRSLSGGAPGLILPQEGSQADLTARTQLLAPRSRPPAPSPRREVGTRALPRAPGCSGRPRSPKFGPNLGVSFAPPCSCTRSPRGGLREPPPRAPSPPHPVRAPHLRGSSGQRQPRSPGFPNGPPRAPQASPAAPSHGPGPRAPTPERTLPRPRARRLPRLRTAARVRGLQAAPPGPGGPRLPSTRRAMPSVRAAAQSCRRLSSAAPRPRHPTFRPRSARGRRQVARRGRAGRRSPSRGRGSLVPEDFVHSHSQ